jgi:hypothetical protein
VNLGATHTHSCRTHWPPHTTGLVRRTLYIHHYAQSQAIVLASTQRRTAHSSEPLVHAPRHVAHLVVHLARRSAHDESAHCISCNSDVSKAAQDVNALVSHNYAGASGVFDCVPGLAVLPCHSANSTAEVVPLQHLDIPHLYMRSSSRQQCESSLALIAICIASSLDVTLIDCSDAASSAVLVSKLLCCICCSRHSQHRSAFVTQATTISQHRSIHRGDYR